MKRTVFILNLLLAVASTQAQTAVPAWVQRYNGPENYADQANALAVDRNDNVFVTGYSYGLSGYMDYATIAYSSAGMPLWTNRYTGPGNFHSATAIAVDTNSNIFVTGFSESSQTYPYNRDYATIKYSGAGTPLWTNRYNGPGNDDDGATAIAMDTNGNVFVTGWSSGGGANYDYATIKYSNAGIPLWTNRYNGPGNNIDRSAAIAVDAQGNIIITGNSAGSSSGYDYATIKYSNAGPPLWTNRYSGPSSYDDEATDIAVDTNGNVFVTGFSGIGLKADLDYLTIAYSSAGAPLWTNRYSGPAGSIDTAAAIAVAINGNVFVTGSRATVAYSNTGMPLWTNFVIGTAIAVDSNGNVFVTGRTASNTDYATFAYSNAGVPLWTNFYNVLATSIAAGNSGNVFVTGNSGDDYATIKYAIVRSALLAIQMMNGRLVLTWSNTAVNLQSAPAITGTFTNIPNATSPYTNSTTDPQRFFRLQAN
jgi:hypothetical protein